MRLKTKSIRTALALAVWTSLTTVSQAQDWSQWRGDHRDGHADFKAPKTWPKELTKKWKVTVGEGVSTPALVGDKLYVFSREEGNEVLRCLNAADGKEIWAERYEALGATGPAQSFSGPRSSPAVADGKVVTIGVRGMISGVDAGSGKKLWRKDEFRAWPNFYPSSSPLVFDGLAVAQLGGRENGGVVAYDLGKGDEKWKWSGGSPAYASPVLVDVGGTRVIVAQTETKTIALDAKTGALLWEQSSGGPGGGGGAPGGGNGGQGGPGGPGGGGPGRGGGRPDNRAPSPLVDGSTVIFSGRGMKAIKLEKTGDKLSGTEIWNNGEKPIQFSTPTLKNGSIFALAGNNELFCVNAKDGMLAWATPFPSGQGGGGAGAPGGPGGSGGPGGPRAALYRALGAQTVFGQVTPPAAQAAPATPTTPAEQTEPARPRGPGGGGFGGPGGPGGGRRGGGMGGAGGFGSIVDAGTVMLALTPSATLVVFEPNAKEFRSLATYKVADGQTHAYPIASGNRIFVKDKDSVTLWTVE